MQENRSFDHYFGKMPTYRDRNEIPGEVDGYPANASNPARDDPSQLIKPYHLITQCHENLTPAWNESHRQWNRNDPTSATATLDGFVYAAAGYSRAQTSDVYDFQGLRAMGSYDWTDIPYYYALASQFAMSDRHFSSLLGPTEPNRMYFVGATSQGYIRPLSAAHGDTQLSGPTIFDLLDKKQITWKIYLAQKDNPKSFTYASMFKSFKGKSDPRVVDAEQFFTDCQNGALPQVAMLESGVNTGWDEHPTADIQTGAAYMARAFNALMKSPLWTKSAMLMTYDEGGGFYDHVAPPTAVAPDNFAPRLLATDTPGDFRRLGFRVPLIAVSPFVKPHYVSHSVSDHTSILKFIEKRFGLPSLTDRDAAAHDLTDMFDFSRMAMESLPKLPSQPTNGTCSFPLADDQ
jgi:phospholipase C